jgi:dTDP-4-dehydrorhamnose reductase
MKILIFGIGGMLGHKIFQQTQKQAHFEVFGTMRDKHPPAFFRDSENIFFDIDCENLDSISMVLETTKPDLVINCIGLIKQKIEETSQSIAQAIKINALFPHKLSLYSRAYKFRLIHFSTDCIFSGDKGNYHIYDIPDSIDIYGQSKFLGEIHASNNLTIRTSIIGHELNSSLSLVDWFLCQEKEVYGYKNAIFSGLPTIEITEILLRYVIENKNLNGLIHLGGQPISKYDLLVLIARQYNKKITIRENNEFNINRSLDSNFFYKLVGYTPKSWPLLIQMMFNDATSYNKY